MLQFNICHWKVSFTPVAKRSLSLDGKKNCVLEILIVIACYVKPAYRTTWVQEPVTLELNCQTYGMLCISRPKEDIFTLLILIHELLFLFPVFKMFPHMVQTTSTHLTHKRPEICNRMQSFEGQGRRAAVPWSGQMKDRQRRGRGLRVEGKT